MEGQLLIMARPEDKAHGAGGEVGFEASQDLERELEWVRMAPKGASSQG